MKVYYPTNYLVKKINTILGVQGMKNTLTMVRMLFLLSVIFLSQTAVSSILSVSNMDPGQMSYSVSGKIDDASMDSFVESFVLKKGQSRTYGGKKGVKVGTINTNGKMVKDTKVFKNGTQIASLLPILDPIDGFGQVAEILVALDGISDVFSFYDFGTPSFDQIIANVDFEFIRFDPGRVAILEEVGTGVRITDLSGALLPVFQFTGGTAVGGLVFSSNIPEPTTLVLLSFGLAAIGANRRKRKVILKKSF